MTGAAKEATLAAVQVGLQRSFRAARVDFVLRGGTGRAPGLRESRVTAELLPSLWTGRGGFGAGIGLGLGGGIGYQQIDGRENRWSGVGYVSPTVLAAIALGQRLALEVSGSLPFPFTLLRRDDRMTVTSSGTLWLGLSWDL